MTQHAALVGTGFMGWVHCEALRRIGVTVTGVLGSTQQKSTAMAARHGIPRAYANYAELLADDQIDVVHVVTPNKTHFPLCRDALRADKHVLCEKPLAMTSSQSAELVQLANSQPHLVAAVNYNMRFYPLCIEAQTRVRSDDIGRIFHVHGSYVQDWLLKPTDYNWRLQADVGGSLRAVADIGTHWLDLVQFITGQQIVAVCADLTTVHPTRLRPHSEVQTFTNASDGSRKTEPMAVDTEDHGHLLFRFDSGATGSLTVSQVTAGRKNCLRFEIAGARKALAWNSESPNALWLGHRDRANEQLVRDPALLTTSGDTSTSYPGGHNEGYADSFKHAFDAFYKQLTTNPPSTPRQATFADGHREIILCEAVLKSHQERRWVEIPSDTREAEQ